MKTLHYSIQINARPEKVWESLWHPENYKTWTKPFSEGSHFKTDSFTQGSKIHFLTPTGEGMYSLIDTVKENQYIAFKHLGSIQNFEEQPINEEASSWSGSMESYELVANENGTEVKVTVDTVEEYIPFMDKAFPQALQALKSISEG